MHLAVCRVVTRIFIFTYAEEGGIRTADHAGRGQQHARQDVARQGAGVGEGKGQWVRQEDAAGAAGADAVVVGEQTDLAG